MKEIIYTPHLKLRIVLRKFLDNYPELIYNNPEMKFCDNLEKNKIAIKDLNIIRNLEIL